MSTLSLRESDSVALRADRIRRFAEENAATLRRAEFGRSFRHDGIRFRVLQNDRNTVYRVDDGMGWYLKLPHQKNPDPIRREILGGEAVREALGAAPEYCHPQAWRASVEHAYVLTSEVKGKPANGFLYRSVFLPSARRRAHAVNVFLRFGRVLGQLHRCHPATETKSTRRLLDAVSAVLRKASKPDELCRQVGRWVQNSPDFSTATCFSHGNLSLGNVLVDGERLALIDFECCGLGSAYDDRSALPAT